MNVIVNEYDIIKWIEVFNSENLKCLINIFKMLSIFIIFLFCLIFCFIIFIMVIIIKIRDIDVVYRFYSWVGLLIVW